VETIVSDDATELTCRAMLERQNESVVAGHYIAPGGDMRTALSRAPMASCATDAWY